jgi:hypothetical protein
MINGGMSSNSIFMKRVLRKLETIENELKNINKKLETKNNP